MIFLLIASMLVMLAGGDARRQTPPLAETELLGTWSGVAEHQGETSPLTFVFERTASGDIRATSVVPAVHARMGWGRVTIDGNRITVGPAVFDYDATSRTLTGVLPPAVLPKYKMSVTLRRDAPAIALRSDVRSIAAPVRQPLWTVDVHAPIWSDLAVAGELLFVGAEDGRLRALDTRTGAVRWTFTTGGAIRARPVWFESDVVVHADDGWMYRINAATGQERWRVQVASTPVERLALDDPASRYETHASAAAISDGRIYVGTHEGSLSAFDGTGKRLWTFSTGDSVVATPVIAHGRVYCGSFDHYLYAIDAESGGLIWKHDTGAAVTSAVGILEQQSTAGRGPSVLVGSRSYDLEAIDAFRGTSIWTKYFWFSWVESAPTVAGGVAYIGSSDATKIFALDAATGRARWETDVAGSAWGQPAVTDSTVYEGVTGVTHYIAPQRGLVIAVDRATGQPKWWFPLSAPESAVGVVPYGFPGSVALANGCVYAGSLDGRLYAFPQ